MKKFFSLCLMMLVCASASAQKSASSDGNVLREIIPLSSGWSFSIGSASKIARDRAEVTDPALNDSDWRKITLPHDFVVDTPYAEGSTLKNIGWDYFYQSAGWYRRHFSLDAEDISGRTQLVLEGAGGACTVYCNGRAVGQGSDLSSVSVFDLTEYVREGDNVICALVNATDLMPSEHCGEGILGNAYLMKTGLFSVAPYGIKASSAFAGSTALISVRTTVDSVDPSESDYASVKHFIYDGTGLLVAESENSMEYMEPYSSQTVEQEMSIPFAARWDQNVPYRYSMETLVIRAGEIVDKVVTPLALRELEYDPSSSTALLNGRSQEMSFRMLPRWFASVGAGVPDGYWRHVIASLKSEGCTVLGIKDPTPSLLDVCDEMGIFVLEQCSDPMNAVGRDIAHPCIAGWVGPDGSGAAASASGGRAAATLSPKKARAIISRIDPSRPFLEAFPKEDIASGAPADEKNRHDAVEVSLSSSSTAIKADGEDIVVVDVALVDKKGAVVTERDRILYVYVDTSLNTAFGINTEEQTGIDYVLSPVEIAGYSNSDPAFREVVRDYISKNVLEIKTYNGRAQVLLRSVAGGTGHAHIRVGGPSIMGRTLTFDYVQ